GDGRFGPSDDGRGLRWACTGSLRHLVGPHRVAPVQVGLAPIGVRLRRPGRVRVGGRPQPVSDRRRDDSMDRAFADLTGTATLTPHRHVDIHARPIESPRAMPDKTRIVSPAFPYGNVRLEDGTKTRPP